MKAQAMCLMTEQSGTDKHSCGAALAQCDSAAGGRLDLLCN